MLLFGLANGALALGIAACLVRAIGMDLTVSAVGLAMIASRRAFLSPLTGDARSLAWVTRSLTFVAGVGLMGVGCWLALATWNRLT